MIDDSLTLDENEVDRSLPPLGSTRCYWCLLDQQFKFVYLDPVLDSHVRMFMHLSFLTLNVFVLDEVASE